MSVTVRVVAKVPCPAGCVEFVKHNPDGSTYSWFRDPGTRVYCGTCHGQGVVPQEARCDSCRSFFRENGVGQCGKLMTSVGYVDLDFACKWWEPREVER